MSRRAPSYTQADVTRLIKGALAAGIEVERIGGVKATKDEIVLLIAKVGNPQANEWDEVLGK